MVSLEDTFIRLISCSITILRDVKDMDLIYLRYTENVHLHYMKNVQNISIVYRES